MADPGFVRHTDVPKWIAGYQFQFKKIKYQRFSYVLYKFGEIPSSNPSPDIRR